MSNDSVSVTSSQSWLGRIGGAIAGVLFGIILFLAAFPVLIWNEGRAIKRAKTLEFGMKAVVSVPDSPIDPANDGKLVHVSGDTAASGPVTDSTFDVSAQAIKLRRNVEMYQWTEEKKSETQKKLGGGEETVTTYSYQKKWSSEFIPSNEFHKEQGHENPGEMPVSTETFTADDVTVGDYSLPENLTDLIGDYQSYPVKTKPDLDEPIQIANGGYYIGKNPKEPAIGDLRINFEVAKPGPVSIVAAQNGKTFEEYTVKGLGTIELLQDGTVSAQSMFQSEQQANTFITWLLRLGGFFLMFIGIALITKPISVFADVIPFLGNLAEFGLGLMALFIAVPLSLTTIALAWLAYRPLIGVPLLLLAIGSIVLGIKALRKKKTAPAAA